MGFDIFCDTLNKKCCELQNIDKEVISDEEAFEAYATINIMKLNILGDYLRFISCVNLLNSYVKQEDAKLNYHFKTFLERFLRIAVNNNVSEIKYNRLSDDKGGYIIIQFGTLQFSFHSVKLDVDGIEVLTDESLVWDNIKKQVCALSIYRMCKSDELLTSNLTKYEGNLENRLGELMMDFKEGNVDFDTDFNLVEMNEEEYNNFMKRYDKFYKYNLPVPFWDNERQVLEYVYREKVDYLDSDKEYDMQVNYSLTEALADICNEGFYYSYNVGKYDENGNCTVGHTHAHSFEDVVGDLYKFPETFSVNEEDYNLFSEQELRYLRRVQKYLQSIGLKDVKDYNDLSHDRYNNPFREKIMGALIKTVDDTIMSAILEGKIDYLVFSHDPEYTFEEDEFMGERIVLRDSNYEIKLLVEYTNLELKPYKEVKDLFNEEIDDDTLVEVQHFNIIERY